MKALTLNRKPSLPNIKVLKKIGSLRKKQNKINQVPEEVKEEEPHEVNVFDEITTYLNKRKLRLVNPDHEFYMRMPQYQSDIDL